jgi:membrane-associated protein
MELLTTVLDIFLHLDTSLGRVIQEYGTWTYLILFLIVFCETGLVVTPFLPGDSLLFAAGVLAARNSLYLPTLYILLNAAAVGGNTLNYQIGYFVGPKVFHKEEVKFLSKKHLERTHAFYEKYGGMTIVIGRFLPIIRTFAPFLAGIGKMSYWRFVGFNLLGSIAWVSAFTLGGYFFGNIPVIKENFTLVILAIIVISFMPTLFGFLRARKSH